MSLEHDKNWPPELLDTYSKLQLPSLWELITAQQTQTLQINEVKESLATLRKLVTEVLGKLSFLDQEVQIEFDPHPIETSSGEEEPSETLPATSSSPQYYPAWEVEMMKQANQLEQRQWEEAYLTIYETLHNLLIEQSAALEQIKKQLKKNNKSDQYTLICSILEDRVRRAQDFRNQLHSLLLDQGIEVIAPQEGELFDDELHRVIEEVHAPSKRPLKNPRIHRLIQCGYYRSGALIRLADVIISR